MSSHCMSPINSNYRLPLVHMNKNNFTENDLPTSKFIDDPDCIQTDTFLMTLEVTHSTRSSFHIFLHLSETILNVSLVHNLIAFVAYLVTSILCVIHVRNFQDKKAHNSLMLLKRCNKKLTRRCHQIIGSLCAQLDECPNYTFKSKFISSLTVFTRIENTT